MNTDFLSRFEDTIERLAALEKADAGDASLAARKRELAERVATVTSQPDLAAQYIHEAEAERDWAVVVACQHWAAPYDNDYLVVSLAAGVPFKALDVVALSSKEDLAFEDLAAAAESGDRQIVLEMVQPLALKGKPWLTSIPVSEPRAQGALYLHHFFFSRERPGQGGTARRVAHRKILDASSKLLRMENPHNVDGVAQVPHPAIPPHRLPAQRAKLPQQVSTSTGLPFKRLFLTLGRNENDLGTTPWQAWVVINVEMAPGQAPQADDYIALADHDPANAYDYIKDGLHDAYQYVPALVKGAYETWVYCAKNVNKHLTIADIERLEKYRLFYARKASGGPYVIVGEPARFKTQKHWMEESLPYIGQKRLHEIVIPGAHDAGTYDPESKGLALNAQAQNLDFSGQLALGIRYFDCRLQNFPKTHPSQPFYFYHGLAMTYTEITDLITALRKFFTEDNSKDIVILDFSRFDGFGVSDYEKFFNLFKHDPLFADAMMTPEEAKQLTINELFAQGKRLYLLSDRVPTARQWLWTLGQSINLDNQWAETSEVTTLKNWLDEQVKLSMRSSELWSLQAILTPYLVNSLVWYAAELFPILHEWVVNEWWQKANVVFCDFTAGTDLVEASMVCNQKRYNSQLGNVFRYAHSGWETGAPLFGEEAGHGGWTGFKSVFASSDGWIYAIDWDGNLFRYDDTQWRQGGGPIQTRQPLSNAGWHTYRQVFASSQGLIYAITGNYQSSGTGKLWRWHDTGGDKLDGGTLIDAGWERYKRAFASSDGWIYGIDPLGKLWRWHDTGTNKLGDPTLISSGWENYKLAFATSNGVIYGIDWHGNVWWWRDTGGNELGNGKQVGTWQANFRMIFATSEGRFYGIKE
ncbi:MAG TPA: tachylectin-related carbohydrate-binding protein [Bryobacteraceae bacterium]|jgi:hypothetical protein|nr:tachylectin-related carbohydrate-binding protein [Bryobacteraceae bacterium]